MQQEYIPYTYLIGWKDLDRWYYGVEYGNSTHKVANPQNLWTVYFTSSKIVKNMVSKYGNPDVIQVRKTFPDKESAVKWEKKVLSRMHVAGSPRWINQNVGGDLPIMKHSWELRYGKGRATDLKKKRSDWMIENNPFRGKKHSLDTKLKISKREYVKGEGHHNYGKKQKGAFGKGHSYHPPVPITVNGTTFKSKTAAGRSFPILKTLLRGIDFDRKQNYDFPDYDIFISL